MIQHYKASSTRAPHTTPVHRTPQPCTAHHTRALHTTTLPSTACHTHAMHTKSMHCTPHPCTSYHTCVNHSFVTTATRHGINRHTMYYELMHAVVVKMLCANITVYRLLCSSHRHDVTAARTTGMRQSIAMQNRPMYSACG